MSPGKRIFDILLSAATLLALSPAILLIAAAVRLSSPGPVLFRQKRLGLGGTPFTFLKFRTMYMGAPDLRNEDGSTWSSDCDPRVTPVGRLLRAASLDELPQLWNVLLGEMSLVGPRPDQVDQLRFYSPAERRKLGARPGITGLAQISGRNRISWDQRKELDCTYVETRSLALDLRILLRTLPCVLRQRDVNQGSTSSEAVERS